MTDSEFMDLIEALSFDLDDAKQRITSLEARLHYHEQTVPHKESQA